MDRKLAAILAADVVGYSTLMERDEAGTFQRLRAGRKELFEPEIARHHGRIFKLMGDGLLAEFSSVVDAVECAVTMQRGLVERNAAVPEDQRIDVRIGVNLGEVIVEGDDCYGEGVNVATRLEQIAEPGSVYVSGKVAKEVERKLAFGFESIGSQKVKNLSEPVDVYKVRLGETAGKLVSHPKRNRHGPLAVAALILMIAALGGFMYFARPPGLFTAPAAAGAPSIAVLAFDNLSGDPGLGYFSDGVSEDIIAMLARSPDLRVIARNSSFTYKGKPTDVRQIGKELSVGHVLEGSVRKDADKVRIVAQLINARTGEHVWAERFDQTGSDPMALQDAVTEKIVRALIGDTGQVKRSAYRDAWGKDTANLDEYDYYLRGHDKFLQYNPQAFDEAYRIWTEGLAKFPDSPLLKLKIGFYFHARAIEGWSEDVKADFRKAGRLAREAMASTNITPLERKLGHWLLAYVYMMEGDRKQALQESDIAISLAPNDPFMVATLALVATAAGQVDKAVARAEFGIQNDPAFQDFYTYLKGWQLVWGERYEEAHETFKDLGNWLPSIPLAKAIAARQLGKEDEAKAALRAALELDPGITAAKWRVILPYDPKIVDRHVADLVSLGLPEV